MLDRNIPAGIKTNEFIPYYQSKMDSEGRCAGVEALVRWTHHERGIISPDEFIPIAEETGIDPARLQLEVTETLLLDDINQTVEKMSALRNLGISFALDDFGTGYSSLAYLKQLPLDVLKIDQGFCSGFA